MASKRNAACESKRNPVLIIPELESAVGNFPGKAWTEQDVAVLIAYYKRVKHAVLAKYLERTVSSVRFKAQQLGL